MHGPIKDASAEQNCASTNPSSPAFCTSRHVVPAVSVGMLRTADSLVILRFPPQALQGGKPGVGGTGATTGAMDGACAPSAIGGKPAGPMIGAGVSGTLLTMVGALVETGDPEGSVVGDCVVGGMVGFIMGAWVGDGVVGALVDGVGTLLSATVGNSEGIVVGLEVGNVEGWFVWLGSDVPLAIGGRLMGAIRLGDWLAKASGALGGNPMGIKAGAFLASVGAVVDGLLVGALVVGALVDGPVGTLLSATVGNSEGIVVGLEVGNVEGWFVWLGSDVPLAIGGRLMGAMRLGDWLAKASGALGGNPMGMKAGAFLARVGAVVDGLLVSIPEGGEVGTADGTADGVGNGNDDEGTVSMLVGVCVTTGFASEEENVGLDEGKFDGFRVVTSGLEVSLWDGWTDGGDRVGIHDGAALGLGLGNFDVQGR